MTTQAPLAPAAGHPAPVDPMLPRLFRVVDTHLDTRDTVTLALEPRSGPPLRFAAGQFTMLHAFGVGEVPISICGDPVAEGPLRHTIRDVGAVTHALVSARRGTTVGVRGPFGTGWAVGDGRGGDVVVVCGGIGLAPLRPALLDLDLPGLDGIALARMLRAQGFVAPLLAVTARSDADAETQARAAGFDDFLRKPVIGAQLAEALVVARRSVDIQRAL